jgi:hypothetical protein
VLQREPRRLAIRPPDDDVSIDHGERRRGVRPGKCVPTGFLRWRNDDQSESKSGYFDNDCTCPYLDSVLVALDAFRAGSAAAACKDVLEAVQTLLFLASCRRWPKKKGPACAGPRAPSFPGPGLLNRDPLARAPSPENYAQPLVVPQLAHL